VAHFDYPAATGVALLLIGFVARGYTEWRIRNESLPWNSSNGPFVISFPKERMYWALVKRNQARAWPLLLGYFGMLGGMVLFIGSILVTNNKAH
jgi:hypothetical protein